MSYGPGYCDNNKKYLQTPLYDIRLKLLLGFNFKVVITGYAFGIMTSSMDVKLSNKVE